VKPEGSSVDEVGALRVLKNLLSRGPFIVQNGGEGQDGADVGVERDDADQGAVLVMAELDIRFGVRTRSERVRHNPRPYEPGTGLSVRSRVKPEPEPQNWSGPVQVRSEPWFRT